MDPEPEVERNASRDSRVGCGWMMVAVGAFVTVAAARVALTPPARPVWRPMSEFGYGPHFDFPIWMYPVPVVLGVAALYFAFAPASQPRSERLVLGLVAAAAASLAMLTSSDSILGGAHLQGYRARCEDGAIEGCIALARCAPDREERMRALDAWCELDPRFGCSALGSAVVRSSDWPETPSSERQQRIAQGITLLSRACEAGAPNACSRLSGIYRNGRYVPPDVDRADHFWAIHDARLRER